MFDKFCQRPNPAAFKWETRCYTELNFPGMADAMFDFGSLCGLSLSCLKLGSRIGDRGLRTEDCLSPFETTKILKKILQTQFCGTCTTLTSGGWMEVWLIVLFDNLPNKFLQQYISSSIFAFSKYLLFWYLWWRVGGEWKSGLIGNRSSAAPSLCSYSLLLLSMQSSTWSSWYHISPFMAPSTNGDHEWG